MQRRYRLRHASDFELLRRKGRRFHHPLLVLVVGANGTSTTRFGFSASRQVGKATHRNRAKRLMRESARHYLDRISGGWDCFFIARRRAADASLAQMSDAVGQTLDRAQLLEKNI
jgi:ribonuclease P protein component